MQFLKDSTYLFFDILADMRRDVQEIFKMTPHEKQVMMFSATLSKEIRPVCRKFMQDVSYNQDKQMFHNKPPVLIQVHINVPFGVLKHI